jgi:hypothetical protein
MEVRGPGLRVSRVAQFAIRKFANSRNFKLTKFEFFQTVSVFEVRSSFEETEFRSHSNPTLSSARMRSSVMELGFPSWCNLYYLR